MCCSWVNPSKWSGQTGYSLQTSNYNVRGWLTHSLLRVIHSAKIQNEEVQGRVFFIENWLCSMQFQPDMPQDWSPSSNACTLREECDVFCALLSKRTKNIYRRAGLDSGHQTSRTEAYSKLAHSAVHILQLPFPERHTALWKVTLSQTAWEHSYSHGTHFRNVTPHIFTAAFGECTFTGL